MNIFSWNVLASKWINHEILLKKYPEVTADDLLSRTRYAKIVQLIRSQNPVILMLQECTDESSFWDLFLDYHIVFVAHEQHLWKQWSTSGGNSIVPTGNAILLKKQLFNQRQIQAYDITCSKDDGNHAPLVYAWYKNVVPLVISSIHLDPESEALRLVQLSNILQSMNRVVARVHINNKDDNLLFMIGGDFNTDTKSKIHDTLVDDYSMFHVTPLLPTHPYITDGPVTNIDHIYIKSLAMPLIWTMAKSEILHNTMDVTEQMKTIGSDHFPLSIHMTVQI